MTLTSVKDGQSATIERTGKFITGGIAEPSTCSLLPGDDQASFPGIVAVIRPIAGCQKKSRQAVRDG